MNTIMIDEGILSVLKRAAGAFSCRKPPVPKNWNSVDRPYVALLLPGLRGNKITRFVLTQRVDSYSGPSDELQTTDLDSLPKDSIIEIKHSGHEFSYYRHDPDGWKKVAESRNPFMVEVYSHGNQPILLGMT